MDGGDLRLIEPLEQAIGIIVVHEKADRTAVHAIDGMAAGEDAVQGLQHQAVAAKRHHRIGIGERVVTIAVDKLALGGSGFRRVAGDEGNSARSGHPILLRIDSSAQTG
jgi:hypothetical protein